MFQSALTIWISYLFNNYKTVDITPFWCYNIENESEMIQQNNKHQQRRPTMKVNAETKAATAFESERIINNSLTWLVAFMFSDDAVLRPEFENESIISIKFNCGDGTYETVTFKRNDPMNVLKEKIRRIVMNGWSVADIELDGRLALNFSYLEKFMKALGPCGGSFVMMRGGFARFVPVADEPFYFWDVVFDGEPL